ncbi:MAG: chromosomal replication initiator protein DnaA [Patescibacteria group bacterium]
MNIFSSFVTFDDLLLATRINFMELENLWEKTLAEVELQISHPNFATWLKNSKLIGKEDGTAVVSLPNNFAKEWVQNKYHKIVLGSLRNLDESIKKVEYVINLSQAPSNFLKNNFKEGGQSPFPEFKTDPDTNLNPNYTFKSFVVGSSNEMAYAASMSIIKELGKKYNPLFIYGGVGVGKTHLIQSIGNEIKSVHNNKVKVRYVHSEKFLNEVVAAIKEKRAETLKNKYRSVDVLIIDDIQFIGGKHATEEEFFHTFNSLYEDNKQIIISSDRSPRFIPTLEERLRSRFEGGMIIDVGYPDYELRVAVLKTKLQQRKAELNDQVIALIANKVQRGLRELEGILNKILFYQNNKNINITPKLVEDIINEIIQQPSKNINPNQIIRAVADFYEISVADITGRSRKQEVVEPRQIACYLLRNMLSLSYPYIGEKLGKRDHTTAIHAFEKISQGINNNQSLSQKILLIKEGINTA